MRQDLHAESRLHWREKPLQNLRTTGEIIGVSRPTLYKLAEEGKLTFKRLGARRTMVETSSIVAHLESAEAWTPVATPSTRRAGGAS